MIDTSVEDAMLEETPPTLPDESLKKADLRQNSAVLATGWLLTWMAITLPALPIALHLKNHLHLGALAIARFTLITGLAWSFKPLAGLVSDSFPLFGSRRRSYLLVAAFLGGLSWLAIVGLPKTYTPLLWSLIVMNVMVMICSTVLGGVLVQVGKDHGATGRLSSHRTAILNVTALLAGPIGGYLAGRAFGITAGMCAGFLLVLVLIAFRYLKEPVISEPDTMVWVRTGHQLKRLFKSKPLWWAIGMNVLLAASPGFATPLLFIQQEKLHLSDQFIGNLGFVAGASGLIGALIYGILCRRITLRPLMYVGILLGGIGSLLYLHYSSPAFSVAIETANGLLSVTATLVLFDLSARAAPDGCEALAYSLMMAAYNLTLGLSDVVGSWLFDQKHVPFAQLVWINAGTTFLILIVVPLIPRVLIDRSDGEPEATPACDALSGADVETEAIG